MISLHIDADSAAELVSQIAALTVALSGKVEAPAPEAEKPKRASAKKDEPKPEVDQAPEPEAPKEEPADAPIVKATLVDAAMKMVAAVNKRGENGDAKLAEILGDYSATKISGIAEAKYAEVLADFIKETEK